MSQPGRILSLACLAACAHAAPARPSPLALGHVTAGVNELAAGDFDRAKAELSLALEYRPGLPQALNGLGLVALAEGDRAQARRQFQAAIAASPDFVEARANLGAVELADGHLEAAAAASQAA